LKTASLACTQSASDRSIFFHSVLLARSTHWRLRYRSPDVETTPSAVCYPQLPPRDHCRDIPGVQPCALGRCCGLRRSFGSTGGDLAADHDGARERHQECVFISLSFSGLFIARSLMLSPQCPCPLLGSLASSASRRTRSPTSRRSTS
jgi:hypothetical protein